MNQQRKVALASLTHKLSAFRYPLSHLCLSLILTCFSLTGFAQNSSYEGDVTPRPTGKNGTVTTADYEQIGRFALNLERTTNSSEFQRADCAPLATKGDGKIGIADIVQSMRFQSGLDTIPSIGGPSETAALSVTTTDNKTEHAIREVKIGTATFSGATVTVPVELVALGNENAVGLTLAFDPTLLSAPFVAKGTDATAGFLLVNSTDVLTGRVGIGIALPAGQVFAAGTRRILSITFTVATSAFGQTTPIGFASSPVPLEVSDALGNLLDQRIFSSNSVFLNYPVPVASSLAPSFVIAGSSSFTLTVDGSNFVSGSFVRWNNLPLTTSFVNGTRLTATVPASYITTFGTANITVSNPSPGGGLSNTLIFSINNPVPILGSLASSFIRAGSGAGSISIFGTGFTPSSIVFWNGRPCPTRFISATQLIVDYSAADVACAGRYTVTVRSPEPGGGISASLVLTIAPTVTSLSPTVAYLGGSSFTATVKGTGFCPGIKIVTGGIIRETTFVDSNTLTTFVSAAEIDSVGVGVIPVWVETDEGVQSENYLPFTISACSPAAARVNLSSALDFGTAAPARESVPLASRTVRTFTVENTGCQALPISLAVRRTGADVQSGKIVNTDDSATFMIRRVTSGGEVAVPTGSPLSIPGFTTATFRVYFDPKIPAPAGGLTNLAASQVIPDQITSTLTVTSGSSTFSSNLTAKVDANSRFINPLAPRLAPLVVFTKSADDIYTVEASGYDANTNIVNYRYQFYDANGNRVGEAPVFDLDLQKLGILKGQSFSIVKKFTANECGRNAATVQVFFYDREDYALATSLPIGTGRGRFVNATSVSAASYQPSGLAAESIAAAFSEKFGEETAAAQSVPLPTDLGGIQIFVTDSNKVERKAALFYVSPNQINYQIPEGTAPGEAKVVIAYKGEVISTGTMPVSEMAPGLFTANSDGTGVPAAYAVRVKTDNSQINESVYEYDAASKRFVPKSISYGNPDDQIYLVLFGTGIRNNAAMPVTARVGGVDAEVVYAGAHGTFIGVDQVNIRLPRSQVINGEVELLLSVGGKPANPVRIQVK